MSTGQTLLALASLILLAKLTLTTNSMILDSETIQSESEAVTTAVGIGQGMLEKISVRGFDDNYPGEDSVDVSLLVPPLSLGPDAGELATADTSFNDIDDFRGFRYSVTTPRFGKYLMTCRVYYVQETAPFDSVGSRTFLKRVDISVTNSYMTNPLDPLKLPVPMVVSRYFGYY